MILLSCQTYSYQLGNFRPHLKLTIISEPTKNSFSIPSILAIVTANASFFQGATFGLLLAIAAIVFGTIGVLLSFSAKKRGGIASFASVAAGLVGIIAAIIKASLYLFG